MTSQRHISGNDRLAAELNLVSSCFANLLNPKRRSAPTEQAASESTASTRVGTWMANCFSKTKPDSD